VNEIKFVEFLTDLLYNDESGIVRTVGTYEDFMVMTHNNGLVVKLGDGSEFQLTVVQTKEAKE